MREAYNRNYRSSFDINDQDGMFWSDKIGNRPLWWPERDIKEVSLQPSFMEEVEVGYDDVA